jgi:hypothetical protein
MTKDFYSKSAAHFEKYRESVVTSKYNNKKTEYNGKIYDSKKEAKYAQELDNLKKAKDPKEKIVSVAEQVRYLLQEGFTDKNNNKHQPIFYIADFVVEYADGRKETIDVKSSATFQTDVYKIKKKLLLYKYPDLIFREVY